MVEPEQWDGNLSAQQFNEWQAIAGLTNSEVAKRLRGKAKTPQARAVRNWKDPDPKRHRQFKRGRDLLGWEQPPAALAFLQAIAGLGPPPQQKAPETQFPLPSKEDEPEAIEFTSAAISHALLEAARLVAAVRACPLVPSVEPCGWLSTTQRELSQMLRSGYTISFYVARQLEHVAKLQDENAEKLISTAECVATYERVEAAVAAFYDTLSPVWKQHARLVLAVEELDAEWAEHGYGLHNARRALERARETQLGLASICEQMVSARDEHAHLAGCPLTDHPAPPEIAKRLWRVWTKSVDCQCPYAPDEAQPAWKDGFDPLLQLWDSLPFELRRPMYLSTLLDRQQWASEAISDFYQEQQDRHWADYAEDYMVERMMEYGVSKGDHVLAFWAYEQTEEEAA